MHVKAIEVYRYPREEKVPMKAGFEKAFLADLNQASEVGPMKYGKTYRILIHYTDQASDTIASNGTLHQFQGWYRSEEDLIKKYAAEY